MFKFLNNIVNLLRDIVCFPVRIIAIFCVTFLIVIKREVPKDWIDFVKETIEITNAEDDDFEMPDEGIEMTLHS